MWVKRLMECSDNHLYSAVSSPGDFYHMGCLHFSTLLSSFHTRRQSCVWNTVGLNVPRCRPRCSYGEQWLKSSPQNFSSGINNMFFWYSWGTECPWTLIILLYSATVTFLTLLFISSSRYSPRPVLNYLTAGVKYLKRCVMLVMAHELRETANVLVFYFFIILKRKQISSLKFQFPSTVMRGKISMPRSVSPSGSFKW